MPEKSFPIAEFSSTSKINLFLDILEKDSKDGYHFLESIFVEIPWGDFFQIFESKDDCVRFKGLGAEKISQENTVSKSLRLFKQKFSIKDCFRIEIHKNIPSGAGLGGGSGDAGALLRFLCSKYRKSIDSVRDIAVAVGSDVSFFLTGGSAKVSGKGEKVQPILGHIDPSMGLLIVSPDIHVSTKEAYSCLNAEFFGSNAKKMKNFLKKSVWKLDFLQENTYNIFEINLVCPGGKLDDMCRMIRQAADPPLCLVSGSGSSTALFYGSSQDAAAAKVNLEKLACRISIQQI